jgi:hypothetical protein
MPSGKDRLYVALYFHKRENTYVDPLAAGQVFRIRTNQVLSCSSLIHTRQGLIFWKFRYHWALFVSPQSDAPNQTTRYHVTNTLMNREGTLKDTWRYEKRILPTVKTAKLLVKVLFWKVEKSRSAFEESVGKVPTVQDVRFQ